MLNRRVEELIEKARWKVITSGYNTEKIQPHELSIVTRQTNKKGKFNNVTLRIGSEIAFKLKWLVGDKILVMIDNDDIFNILLTKSENKSDGRKLAKSVTGNTFEITFSWKESIDLPKIVPQKIKYEIYEKYLYFRIPHE